MWKPKIKANIGFEAIVFKKMFGSTEVKTRKKNRYVSQLGDWKALEIFCSH